MNKTILLLDSYNEESQNLVESLSQAGFDGTVMVVNDDGFLPDGFLSAVRLFGDESEQKLNHGKPRYFNQIDVPDYWEISGNGINGKIQDLNKERGKIVYYGDRSKRLVSQVEWYDGNNVIRSIDHYDKNGIVYAHTTFSKDGKLFCKSMFDASGKEILVENYMTGDIILNRRGQVNILKNKTQLVLKMIESVGNSDCRIIYNSLSIPFFASEQLPENGKKDVLIWQENPRDDVPGNMLGILNGTSKRTGIIYVQKKQSYENLIKNGAESSRLSLLGNIYKFRKDNNHSNEILICTNSDQIEKLEMLVRNLPEMHFNIAAVTEMSAKLLQFERYKNVACYPAVNQKTVNELFLRCDYYLDINHGNEILKAAKSAFLYNQLVLGFIPLLHNPNYVHSGHRFSYDECDKMITLIRECNLDKSKMEEELANQREHALAESVDKYKSVFEIN